MQAICCTVVKLIALAFFGYFCCSAIVVEEYIIRTEVNIIPVNIESQSGLIIILWHLDTACRIAFQVVCSVGKLNVLIIKIDACNRAFFVFATCNEGRKTKQVNTVFDDIGVKLTACRLLHKVAHGVSAIAERCHCKTVVSVKCKH